MKIQPYIEKLNSSKEYKDFQAKYKDAFLIAGFFILDFDVGKNVHQIDYYLPSQKKVAAFTLDDKVSVQILDVLDKEKTPQKLDLNAKVDLDALQGIIQDEMKNRNMTEEIKKMIAVIQNVDGKKIWNVSCVLSGMEVLKAHVEDKSQTVLKMEKSSVMDLMKKLPMSALSQANPASSGEGDDPAAKLKQLDKIKEAIEKEKKEFQKQIKAKKTKPKK